MRAQPVFLLARDKVAPKRRFVLRADYNQVVHWALEDMNESPYATPWCGADTEAKLMIFFRGANRYDFPTCLWCALEPFKRVRSA